MSGSAVDTPDLHMLNGTARQPHGANVVALVTNGRFTSKCPSLAHSQNCFWLTTECWVGRPGLAPAPSASERCLRLTATIAPGLARLALEMVPPPWDGSHESRRNDTRTEDLHAEWAHISG
ncbi:hypothetical protein [Streptomyces cucumeris]|uniref:hypothetical protein n=1 Tax=Streptomyces cucumeris TaxID=2962890 RepID=UPI003D7109C6